MIVTASNEVSAELSRLKQENAQLERLLRNAEAQRDRYQRELAQLKPPPPPIWTPPPPLTLWQRLRWRRYL
jgi:hypothetical protein